MAEASQAGEDIDKEELEKLWRETRKANAPQAQEIEELEERWREIRKPVHNEVPSFKSQVSYEVDPTTTLREKFRDTGLQIIVKMASIELTPEKPSFSPGSWHIEGMMNEHIVATALYYLDSHNVTDSHLEFRALASDYQRDWNVGQDAYS